MNSGLAGLRILRRDLRGSSSPVVVETSDGLYFTKLRGAAQGTATLVAEVIVAAIADAIGLPVPPRRVITLSADTPSNDHNDELADLLRASVGENLGFRYLEKARGIEPADLERMSVDFASQVRWLDWLVMNADRGPANPNILVEGARFWLIDHGACLPFQHDWKLVTEASPGRVSLARPHVLDGVATRVNEWSPILASQMTRAVLSDAVAQVPDSFLIPLLPPAATGEQVERRRSAYAAFLWKRVQHPRVDSRP